MLLVAHKKDDYDSQLTFERGVVAPVREHTLLDLLVQALLHAVHVLELVRLGALVLRFFAPCNGLFKGRGAPC